MNSDVSHHAANNTCVTVIIDNNAVRTVPSRKTVLRMNAVENRIVLDLFIQNSIAANHGSEALDALEGIVRMMCNNDSVRGSSKAIRITHS